MKKYNELRKAITDRKYNIGAGLVARYMLDTDKVHVIERELVACGQPIIDAAIEVLAEKLIEDNAFDGIDYDDDEIQEEGKSC